MSSKHKRKKKAGLSPGTVVFTGDQKIAHPIVNVVQYNPGEFQQEEIGEWQQLELHPPGSGRTVWYDVRGLHDVALIEKMGAFFKIHPLVLEDIVNTQQVPKFEEYKEGLFIVLRALSCRSDAAFEITTEQISIFVGAGFVLSFQEDADDIFTGVRDRLQNGLGRMRQRKGDYLAYAMVDTIVDNYLVLMEKIENELEEIEASILASPNLQNKVRLYELKRELITVRKSVMPLREAIGKLLRSESHLIQEGTSLFWRDLYDHTAQVLDMFENYREVAISLQDMYSAEMSYRMNNVMKVLTIISTIFIPLTFIVGVYGMNFDNMPELRWEYGYYACLALMGGIFFGLLYYFWRKRWL